MITLESITEKLGFNPLEVKYDSKDGLIDDSFDPMNGLTSEEAMFVFELALKTASCWGNGKVPERIKIEYGTV